MRCSHRAGFLAVLLGLPLLLGQGCPAPSSDGGGGGGDGGGGGGGGGGGSSTSGPVLTVNIEGQGTVDPSGGTFTRNATITLTATPSAGWRFDHWSGDLSGGPYDFWRDSTKLPANPATLQMSADRTVTAVFVARKVDTETFVLPGDVALRVVNVPGGTFTMGSSSEEQTQYGASGVDLTDESPQHEVTVSSFAIGETEVMQAQYRALMGTVPTIPVGCTVDCVNDAIVDDHPVAWLSWHQAVAFCDALSTLTGRLCRLPTEAEWEFACRAGATSAYSFGEDSSQLGDYAWYSGNSGYPDQNDNTHPVRMKLPNALGLYDMHGNAWEWVGDWYGLYPTTAQVDPKGAATTQTIGPRKVLRGGAYSRYARYLRSAYRYDPSGPSGAQFNFGLRVVCE